MIDNEDIPEVNKTNFLSILHIKFKIFFILLVTAIRLENVRIGLKPVVWETGAVVTIYK